MDIEDLNISEVRTELKSYNNLNPEGHLKIIKNYEQFNSETSKFYYCNKCCTMTTYCKHYLQEEHTQKWKNINEYIIKKQKASTELCRICLNGTKDYAIIDAAVEFTNWNNMHGKTTSVKTMLRVVLPKIDFNEKYIPHHICDECLDKTVNAYMLIKQYETSNLMMKNCVNNLFESTISLQSDNLKPSKKLSSKSSMDYRNTKILYNVLASDKKEDLNLNILRKKQYSNNKKVANIYECTMCSENYSDPKLLSDHVKIHPLDLTHICRQCGKMFKTITDLTVHKRRHKIILEKTQVICHECGKVFNSELNLKRHSVSHRDFLINCDVCQKKFQTKSLLRTHILNNHEIKTNAMCDICGKVFTNLASVTSHMNSHRTKKCPYCQKILKTHVSYDYHIKKHKTGIGRQNVVRSIYKCNDCDYNSCNKSTLEGHMNKMHLNRRPYICTYLKCDKRFFTKGNLIEHTRLVHLKEKLEKCDQCGANFVNQKCYQRHIRLHTTERPFSCDLCGKSFISVSRRNEHKKRTHNYAK